MVMNILSKYGGLWRLIILGRKFVPGSYAWMNGEGPSGEVLTSPWCLQFHCLKEREEEGCKNIFPGCIFLNWPRLPMFPSHISQKYVESVQKSCSKSDRVDSLIMESIIEARKYFIDLHERYFARMIDLYHPHFIYEQVFVIFTVVLTLSLLIYSMCSLYNSHYVFLNSPMDSFPSLSDGSCFITFLGFMHLLIIFLLVSIQFWYLFASLFFQMCMSP